MSSPDSWQRQRGATLMELSMGLATGMLVVLAALAALALLQSSAAMQGDASRLQQKLDVALSTLGWQVRQAGAIELRSLQDGVSVSFSRAFDGYGGSGHAVSGDEGTNGRPDVLRVSYEDRIDARDCLGNRPDSALAGVRIDNRFSVSAGELRCLGAHGGTGAQVIVDGVEDFQVQYGLRSGAGPGARWAYLDAGAIAGRWSDVQAVRICLQVAGQGRHDAALGAASAGCSGAPLPADGKLRRVAHATFHLRSSAP